MDTQNIVPEKITKPIQLLAAWLLGLILVNGSFLTAASQLLTPNWLPPFLVIAAVINVPIFLLSIFLLQTKYRPEMQEDTYYSKYLEQQNIIEKSKITNKDDFKKAAEQIFSEFIKNNEPPKIQKIESILKDNNLAFIKDQVKSSRALSQLYLFKSNWEEFVSRWKNDSSFMIDVQLLLQYGVAEGPTNDFSKVKLTNLGKQIAESLKKEDLLWDQHHNRNK